VPWIVLHLRCERGNHEALEEALLERGAAAVTLADAADHPLFEPGLGEMPLWQTIRLSGLFDASVDAEGIMAQLKAKHSELTFTDPTIDILEDKDWVRSWMDDYQPIAMGHKLWICPSWKAPPDPTAVNLILDPGMAFGTGTHPTTAMCLQWLDSQSTDRGIGHHVIDFGCGSGILAIAALLLGATEAWGVDIDPQALITARDNASRNHVSEQRLHLLQPEHADTMAPADTVLANILAKPLLELAPTLTCLLKPGGKLVLSGILETQTEMIIRAYPEIHFDKPRTVEEWALLSGTRRTQG